MARTWRSKYYCPPPFGTNNIIPIKDVAQVSCVNGSTTDRDPISKKRKADDGNSIASDDSKEYDESTSKKRKTEDHNVCELSEDLKKELSKLYRVPLQDEDWTRWLKFTDHAKRASALRGFSNYLFEQEKKSIRVDHPFVRVIGEFAVATFNKLREMFVKKGNHNSICNFEITECQYLHMSVPRHYFIYMTIEAFEKGKLGVYEARIVCYEDDGRRTLTKFVLTDRKPVGKKAMAMSPSSRLIYIYKSVEGLIKDIETYTQTAQQSKKGEENGNVAAEFCRLKEHYKKAIKGLGKVLSRDTQAPARNPTTNRGLGKVLSRDTQAPARNPTTNRDTSGMVRRTKGTTCKGYDYYNPVREFGVSLLW